MKRTHIITLIVLLVLVIDQASKIWVKTNMYISEDSFLHWGTTPYWARIHFVENDGMAFGLELGGEYGKLALSLFRIVAVGFLIYFIQKLIQSKAKFGLLVSFALILAGAIGNILDSAFYGLIFSASSHHHTVAQMFPEGGGYSSFLHGKVVDMFYFPLWDGNFPEWFPFWAGQRFEFFRPVFNVADVAISTGVISILLFQRSFFNSTFDEDQINTTAENETEVPEAVSPISEKEAEEATEAVEKMEDENIELKEKLTDDDSQ